MTSTNMFQGLESGSKPSSRVLQPPGGGSSNLFGAMMTMLQHQEDLIKWPLKCLLHQRNPRTYPDAPILQVGRAAEYLRKLNLVLNHRDAFPGGSTSILFGAAERAPVQNPNRNKPVDNLSVGPEHKSPAPEPKVSQPVVTEEAVRPAPVPAKEAPAPAPAPASAPVPEPKPATSSPSSSPPDDETSLKKHEPHLGPRPRSHNRVLSPPGGKSSVVFY